MPQVISLGEALIDIFAPTGTSLKAADRFTPSPGGAPANVAVALARLDVSVGFIGTVGDDPFGLRLIELRRADGVDTTHFRQVADSPTTLAFVASASPTQQDFILYRGADTRLTIEDIDRAYLAAADVFVYGSVTLTAEARDTALQAVQWAKADGVTVAYDANLRPALWPDLTAARQGILAGLEGVDICKVNETELELLTGTQDVETGCRWLLEQGVGLCLVTLGRTGTFFSNGQVAGLVPTFEVEAVNTTGSGDAFLAAVIAGLLDTTLNLTELNQSTLFDIVRFANAAGALNATFKGAMTSLPTRSAVKAFINQFGT